MGNVVKNTIKYVYKTIAFLFCLCQYEDSRKTKIKTHIIKTKINNLREQVSVEVWRANRQFLAINYKKKLPKAPLKRLITSIENQTSESLSD